ncbi:GDSL-type esterase/lipase family protein [Kitasatospora paranensis]|uniref:GDSL-type esterase/lipase family protein n=1 Tax=Kitasatospora paranensis TaxID=258053 RepID=A0ABW2FUW0_9ACTN
MKRPALLTVSAVLLAAGVVASPAQAATASAPTVRVLPLGDSITFGQGSCTGGGYRQPLSALTAGHSGYAVDFVGGRQHGAMTDPEHEGHPGDTIDQIRAGVDGWLASSRPDVVLLHIGINDLNQNLDQAHAADRATQLIDRIFTDRPNVTVVMQGLIPTTPGWWNQDLSQPVAQYNGRLRQLEATEQQAGRHFRFVDAPALTPANRADATHPAQMTDGLHPNDAGYSLLAQNFHTALDEAYAAGWFSGGSPSASSPWAGTVHLANVTPDGSVHNTEGNYTARSWAGWSDLGGIAGTKEVAAAATYSVHHLFAIGADNRLYEKDGDYAAGRWSDWTPLPGSPSVRAVTASSYGDTVHLAVIGTDGHLYNSDGVFPDGGWNGWTDHGGTDLKRLASATTTRNVNHLYVLDGNNGLQELDADYCAGAWSGWSPAANGFTGQDVAAAAAGDTVHLDAIGMDGNLYNTEGRYDLGSWNGWSNMGGGGLKRLTSATAQGVNHIFAINSANRLTEIDADYNTGRWNSWAEPAGGADSIGLTAAFTS